MFNGLDNFNNLGRYRRSFVFALAALIPFLSFCDFSDNDKANLENIAYYISYLQSNHTELTDIEAQLTTLSGIESYTYDAVTILNSIASTLQSLTPGVIGTKIDSVRVAVEDVGDMVYYLRQDNNKYHKTVTNTLNQGFYDVVEALDNWGYGISNALANIQPSGAIYTNFPSLLVPTLYDNWNPDNYQVESELFYLLTGNYPHTSDELDRFSILLFYAGELQRFFQDKISSLGHPGYDDRDMSTIYDALLTRLEADLISPTLTELGELHYYEYGTRPLITLFEQYYAHATNDFPVVGNSIDGTGTNSSYSTGFVSAVGGLAESFTHSTSIDEQVSTVSTNPIVDIENQGYNNFLTRVTSANLQDTTVISGVSDAVANIQNEFQSLISLNSSSDSYTFDFGTLGAFGTSHAVSFTLSRPSSPLYWNVQDFFFAVLKAIALLLTVYSIYIHIAAETEV